MSIGNYEFNTKLKFSLFNRRLFIPPPDSASIQGDNLFLVAPKESCHSGL